MISKKGIELIKTFEGFVPLEYTCVAGKRTIGYGHVLEVEERYPCGLSLKKAEEILQQDISFAEQTIENFVEVELSENQKDALVSFIFNVGANAFAKSTLLRCLNKGEYHKIPKQLQRWVYAAGKISQGLVRRREAEAKLFKK